MSDSMVVGTRGSRLALIQTESIVSRIENIFPELEVKIEIIQTAGDKVSSAPFKSVGASGIFVREIEKALAERKIDIAVHSLKDLQTDLHPDLIIGAITERESACDVLISRHNKTFENLPSGAVIGTSSTRRKALIAIERPDIVARECRGNIPTRLAKLDSGEFDAIIVAEAGIARLGLTARITERLDFNRFIPAVGQGAIGVEIRRNDNRVLDIVRQLNHEPTYAACMEERAFLRQTGGGCHVPVGAFMRYENNQAIFSSFISTCDGKWFAREQIAASADNSGGLGEKMAERMRSHPGFDAFLREVAQDAD
ncbi:MAG TPA: hydroxymethylbilane synthase [Firmicutes bacterium]|nr:hydroxymethylbilane synthase [Bacillota bacterium]